MPRQASLPIPFPELPTDQPLIPVRMVNEFVYCPRLAYLEWAQAEWRRNVDTVQGAHVHRRVDQPGGTLPAPDLAAEVGPDLTLRARSIELSSQALGIIARMDLVETSDGRVIPVDYKTGHRKHTMSGAYQPERIQLCAQGLILREHGYTCENGAIYFAGSKERVPVVFDSTLIEETMAAISGLRLIARQQQIPPPLIDSPKCLRCSMAGICLPDETNFVNGRAEEVRPMTVGITDTWPLHVQANYADIRKSGETLEVRVDGNPNVTTARLIDLSEVILQGNVMITTPALHELLRREIPLVWTTHGGWYLGHTQGVGHKNVELRTEQYRHSFDERRCLQLARGWVIAKLTNQRVMLRRNWRGREPVQPALDAIDSQIRNARHAENLASLLGHEGSAAATYFGEFPNLLKPAEQDGGFDFDFKTRNRRPPTDPVNALLSFAYAMLTRQWVTTLAAVGFDPYRGYFHQPRYGKPALALDMMEPFRPLVADSTVLQVINNGEIKPGDFQRTAAAVALTEDARRAFIEAFERRLDHEITHPLFKYRLSYRRLFELHARLLGRYLLGELDDNPNFTTR